MTYLRRIASIVRGLFNRTRLEAELDDELRTFVEMAAADSLRDGASPEEARRLATLRLGGVEQAKERVRTERHGAWLETLGRDVRFGLRQVRRAPAFSAVAIATLALGIGGLTAMFSAFDAVLIRPLPYTDADRLVMIWDAMGATDVSSRHNPPPAEWIEWRRLNTVFSDLAMTQTADLSLSGGGEPEQVPARKATWNLWDVLGVRPLRGRVFTEEEDTRGVHVAVISYRLWQRRFGGEPDIIGRKIALNDEPYEVIGVMPPSFYFLPSRDVDLWTPTSFPAWMRKNFTWHDGHVVARLKPGVTVEQARASMVALSLQVTAKDFRGPHAVFVIPMREELAGRTGSALTLLLAASAALLLIACVNLTNLLLSRGAARAREVAVRVALGAPRGRLVSQFLTESVVLAALGAVAALILAVPAMRFLERLVPEEMGATRLALDWRVLAFAAATAVAAAVLFGLVPALRGSRLPVHQTLRDGGRGTSGRRSHWFQHTLIVVETALAVVLLTCGGLLLQTFQHLRHTDLGMRNEHLLTFETPLFRYKDFDRRTAFINAEVDQVRRVPGVVDAASINLIPFTNSANATFYLIEGQSLDNIAGQVALIRNVTRGYFNTVGAGVQDGRSFEVTDRHGTTPVAIVNETFARRAFPGGSALGRRFKFGDLGSTGYWYTIIGVVHAIPETGVLDNPKPAVYRVYEQCDQIADLNAGIVVRTTAEPASVVSAVRAAIWSIDKNQPLARIRPMSAIVDRQLSTSSQSTALLGAFAGLALVLASLGIYGVLSFAVSQRTNEIGVRMALGATSNQILRSFGCRGVALTICGLAIGLPAAVLASRLLTTLLFGFQPNYAPAAAGVSLALLTVAATASFVPARRAARIDPMQALRLE